MAVPTQALVDSDLEVGKVYLFDAPNCPDVYCGEWVCIDGVNDDNLCRDTAADPDDCGDCAQYDGSLAEPYELEPSPSQAFWNLFTETETNDCCDIICPTICDDFGTPVDCYDPFGSDCAEACFNAGLIQYQLDVGTASTPATTVRTVGGNCGDRTITTTADTEFIGSWSGTAPSRAGCQDDVLLIGVIYRINFTTTPWDCDEFLDTTGACGGWCVEAEGNPPPNNQYDYFAFVIEVGPCGSTTSISVPGVGNPYASVAIPGYVAAYNALQEWDDVTNGCGFGLNPSMPNENTASSQTTTFTHGIGWGGDAICLDRDSKTFFKAMVDCTGGTTQGSTQVLGELDWSIRLRLSLPNRPDPCI